MILLPISVRRSLCRNPSLQQLIFSGILGLIQIYKSNFPYIRFYFLDMEHILLTQFLQERDAQVINTETMGEFFE